MRIRLIGGCFLEKNWKRYIASFGEAGHGHGHVYVYDRLYFPFLAIQPELIGTICKPEN
jgi:hypothetical protein